VKYSVLRSIYGRVSTQGHLLDGWPQLLPMLFAVPNDLQSRHLIVVQEETVLRPTLAQISRRTGMGVGVGAMWCTGYFLTGRECGREGEREGSSGRHDDTQNVQELPFPSGSHDHARRSF
jgi:hypothetical protein